MADQITPPQGEATPPVDPREGLNLKKAQIQLLEAELSEIDASLDAEFLEKISDYIDPQTMEMRFEDDVRPFLSAIEDAREIFYREKLDALKGKLDTMKGEAADEEETLNIDDAKRSFLEAHPEADWTSITDFFNNDMSPRQKEELVGLENTELMEAVYAIYSKKNKIKPNVTVEPALEEKLPPDLNNTPSSAVVGDPSPAAKDEGYLARIGVRR